jgi:hypothetical protein
LVAQQPNTLAATGKSNNQRRALGSGGMALLSFPPSPTSGQIYPVSPPAGTNIYSWDSTDQTWVLIGKASGVTAGIYGTPIAVPEITVDATGRITLAQNLPIQLADTTQVGLVQLVDDTISNDSTKALTAAQGYYLQIQIGNTALLNPFYPNLVTAINALGGPTGVTPGTYGSGTTVGRFTVNAQGRITSATSVPLTAASTISPGVVTVGANLAVTGTGILSVPNASTTVTGAVRLVNNTTTNDPTKALTAAAGYSLQQQVDSLSARNNLTFAGTLNGSLGVSISVTPEASAVGFVVGSPLPVPALSNDEFFVVVTVAGTFTPPSSPTYSVRVGDWLISDGFQWVLYPFNLGSVTQVNTGIGLTGGPITTTGTVTLKPATTAALGGVIPDGSTIKVTSAGVITAPPQKFVYLDDISALFDGALSTFTLRLSGAPYSPVPSSNVMITVGGVLQDPNNAYSVSGSTITFTGAPPTGASFIGVTVS